MFHCVSLCSQGGFRWATNQQATCVSAERVRSHRPGAVPSSPVTNGRSLFGRNMPMTRQRRAKEGRRNPISALFSPAVEHTSFFPLEKTTRNNGRLVARTNQLGCSWADRNLKRYLQVDSFLLFRLFLDWPAQWVLLPVTSTGYTQEPSVRSQPNGLTLHHKPDRVSDFNSPSPTLNQAFTKPLASVGTCLFGLDLICEASIKPQTGCHVLVMSLPQGRDVPGEKSQAQPHLPLSHPAAWHPHAGFRPKKHDRSLALAEREAWLHLCVCFDRG